MAATVHLRHVREAKYCMKETREFFRRNDFSWQDFIDNGISIDVLLETGDPRAAAVADIAIKEQADGRR